MTNGRYLKKVLVLKPFGFNAEKLKEQLHGKVELIFVLSLSEFKVELKKRFPLISAFVISCSDVLLLAETEQVVRECNGFFSSSKIVVSSQNVTRERLARAGCNRACDPKNLGLEIERALAM